MWRSSAVFNYIEENHSHEHRVGEPMVKSSGERASVIERMGIGQWTFRDVKWPESRVQGFGILSIS